MSSRALPRELGAQPPLPGSERLLSWWRIASVDGHPHGTRAPIGRPPLHRTKPVRRSCSTRRTHEAVHLCHKRPPACSAKRILPAHSAFEPRTSRPLIKGS